MCTELYVHYMKLLHINFIRQLTNIVSQISLFVHCVLIGHSNTSGKLLQVMYMSLVTFQIVSLM